jgi:condensin complex subunit 1
LVCRSSIITAIGYVVAYISKACNSAAMTGAEMNIISSLDSDLIDEAFAKPTKPDAKLKTASKSKRSKKGDSDEESDENDSEDEEQEEDDVNAAETHTEPVKSEASDINKNKEQLTRLRESLIEILIERVHDKSPYTRSNVLKVWSLLVEENAIPVRKIGLVAEIGLERLADKTANVRKNAMSLLTTLLENNPFGGVLDIDNFNAQKEQLEAMTVERFEQLKEKLLGDRPVKPTVELTAIQEGDENDEEAEMQNAIAEVELEELMKSPEVLEDSELNGYKLSLDCCSIAIQFLSAIASSIPTLEILLTSTTSGDVVEALRFFTRAVNFGVKGSATSLRRAFSLVWHQDATVRNECLASFCAVYLTDGAVDGTPTPLSPVEMAENLVQLLLRCDDAELTSLEKIIGEIFKQANGSASSSSEKPFEAVKFAPDFDVNVIQALWSSVAAHNAKRFQLQQTNGDGEEAQYEIHQMDIRQQRFEAQHLGATLHIIAMITKFSPQLLTPSRIRLIDQCVFNSPNKHIESSVLRSACICLQSAASHISLDHSDEKTTEYRNALLAATPGVRDVLLGAYCGDSEDLTNEWFSACEEAMHALFHIHPSPDKVFSSIIAPLYQSLSGGANNAGGRGPTGSNKILCKPARLARFLFLLGQGALGSLVFVEKIASLAKAAKAKSSEKAALAAENKKTKSKAESAEAEDGADAMEEQMGLAASADAEHDMKYNFIVENQLVLNNLLSKFVPLVSFVVANQKGGFAHQLLRKTSILTLCRLMSISSALCEANLPLLFTVLDKESSEFIRTTTLIALADLAFRFPNALEPWNAHLYSRLSDKSELVRYNTLTVLTHLVLNDMIKVKGQVTNIVVCLSDPSQKIRDLAKLFFTKLSDRSNNPVYNLLGDIIANLSMDSGSQQQSAAEVDPNEPTLAPVEEAKVPFEDSQVAVALVETAMIAPYRVLTKSEFQSTMSFMLSFVKKDK